MKQTTMAPGGLAYYQKIRRMFRDSLIAYWPLDEVSGTVAKDVSGSSRNGTHTAGVVPASTGAPGGKFAPLYPESNSNTDLYSASLASAFNGAEGTMSLWIKPVDAGVWTDATQRYAIWLQADANNLVVFQRNNSADRNCSFAQRAGGTWKSDTVYLDGTGWKHLAITWSASNDRVRLYINGALYTAALTTLGTWAGSLASTTTRLGGYSTATYKWNGYISNVVLLNREATAAEVRTLATDATAKIKWMGILGDSITLNEKGDVYWTAKVRQQYDSGSCGMINHSGNGEGVISKMATQSTAAASDNDDVIIIALGTNDDDAGNMTTLQATYEAGIASLKASNSRATIYGMNVLPRWADQTAGAEVAKGNIRTAIAAACTAQGITCWDTYTDPWIAQNETTDGLHPTAAGHAAIAARVLALL